MKTLKKLDPLSVGKLYAVLMALIQLIVGILMLIAGETLGPYLSSVGAPAMGGSTGVMVLVTGVIGGLIGGFIIGIIGAWLYNLVAGWVGGIKVELE